MGESNTLALDRSLRSTDLDGHMRVEMSRISKASICPYRGNEIPRWRELGLDPDRIYRLFRDPAELERGAHSFDGKPLLIRHVPVSAVAPRQQLCVGSIGVCEFEPPYLISRPLTVWTQEAKDLIASGEQRELSAAYRYDAEMVPGSYGGEAYDGRMVNIQGNHVAIVSEGRAGPDVHVADELPEDLKPMPLKNPQLVGTLMAVIGASLAADADPKKLQLALDGALDAAEGLGETPPKSVMSLDEAEKKAAEDEYCKEHGKDSLSDEEKEEAYERARDKKAKDKKAKDAKHGKDGKHAKDASGKHVSQNMSGDADPDHRKDFEPNAAKDSKFVTVDEMNAAVKAGITETRRQERELAKAREDVRPIVGVVSLAMDSAEEVYRHALDKAGVKTKDVHPSAYPALLELALSNRSRRTAPVHAMDSNTSGQALNDLLGLN